MASPSPAVNQPPTPTAQLPSRGSELWFAEKLSQKKDLLTYSLLAFAGARMLWITQRGRRVAKASGAPPNLVVGPQLVVWAIFWPTALVVLRTGIKWAERKVAKSGMELPPGKQPRAEVEGDSRKDL